MKLGAVPHETHIINSDHSDGHLFLVHYYKSLGTRSPSVFIGGSVSIPLLLHRRHVSAKLHGMAAHNRFDLRSLRSPACVEKAGQADHGDESPNRQP